ncbi:GAF and ANTAR domain-containing protein [Actinomadura flavalba]|uniref:GAF and ANTAR domain-containing protein n=1 Tax=Actinomadura flavalba TaxID=1120938 RepID=UPI000381C925|nr:GAF and ANTAR domain-containing protein [Actinomadura flavalba]
MTPPPGKPAPPRDTRDPWALAVDDGPPEAATPVKQARGGRRHTRARPPASDFAWRSGREPRPGTVGVVPTTDAVLTDQLAVEIARLGVVGESSDAGTLHRVTELASRAVRGCAGASAVRWALPADDDERPEPLASAASHPDLADAMDRQIARGRGPVFDVVRTRRPAGSDDILAETRWSETTADLLRRGVRCFSTTPHLSEPVLVTLTLYGVTPRALGAGRQALASLLVAQGSNALSNSLHYGDVHRTAVQLQEAVESRAVVDQAKGILMHALGCGADEAFAEMRRISQTRHVKLTALAERIVVDQGLL